MTIKIIAIYEPGVTSKDEVDSQLRRLFGDAAVDAADEFLELWDVYLKERDLQNSMPAESKSPKS